MTESVVAYVERLDDAVRDAVGSCLVGTYLHGSAALGGFVPGRSDVDALLIVSDATLPITAGELATVICSVGTDCPGRGLELSAVTATAAGSPAAPWPFIIHVATDGHHTPTIIEDRGQGDPDLLMHYAVVRAASHPISGPPPPDVIGTIAAGSIARYLVDELDWALTKSTAAYAVLNACRAWRFATDAAIVSKLDGAAWALDQGAPTEIVDRAVQAQLGEDEHHAVTPAVVEFVHGIQSTVRRSIR